MFFIIILCLGGNMKKKIQKGEISTVEEDFRFLEVSADFAKTIERELDSIGDDDFTLVGDCRRYLTLVHIMATTDTSKLAVKDRENYARLLLGGMGIVPFPRAEKMGSDEPCCSIVSADMDCPGLDNCRLFDKVCLELAQALWYLKMAKHLLRPDFGKEMFPFDSRNPTKKKRREHLASFIKKMQPEAARLGLTQFIF